MTRFFFPLVPDGTSKQKIGFNLAATSSLPPAKQALPQIWMLWIWACLLGSNLRSIPGQFVALIPNVWQKTRTVLSLNSRTEKKAVLHYWPAAAPWPLSRVIIHWSEDLFDVFRDFFGPRVYIMICSTELSWKMSASCPPPICFKVKVGKMTHASPSSEGEWYMHEE